ncbi:MAG: double-strand break repair helicase AddA [Devosia sp.]
MSRRLVVPMPERVVISQRVASDPERSAWVTANAGSGKTHVLTARVLRLLQAGARPEQILCLTYTKAAAAEMRGRIAERLGRWPMMSDAQLTKDIADLSGEPPSPAMQKRARTLFAQALETPGGLKIQTIHAFCESVLHRFPREAGVPFDFKVLEEHERDILLREAREQVIAAGLRGSGEAAAVETLFGLLTDFSIEQSIIEALNRQRVLRQVLRDPDAAKRELRKLIGNARSIAAVERDILSNSLFPRAQWQQLFDLLPPDPSKMQRLNFCERLYRLRDAAPDAAELLDAFLKDGREPYRDRCMAKISDVALAGKVGAEHDRLAALAIELNAAELLERSEAMLDIVAAISAHYERAKRRRSLLDFDDLIERLAQLLRNPEHGDWVRYKLDAGISHILVDEGQDTNLQQWQVVEALVEDFFAGASAAERPRTLFAVGDQKQSIFSFQGADPQVFLDFGSQAHFSAMSVKLPFTSVPLRFSFRSLPEVLGAVDRVFTRPDLLEGALEGTMAHETVRAETGGSVTLWPPIKDYDEASEDDQWPLEPPKSQIQGAPRRVAERIATEIARWLAEQRPVGPRGRPVRPEDILILVQVRSVLFHEIIRALNQQRIATPGADRLAVTTHIGVLDLMALGDVLSNVSDDLQLAAMLRSPLFDVDEDDLFELAHGRPSGQRLWGAMEHSSNEKVRTAFTRLHSWRSRLDFERPFEFYSDVLYREGGLKRMRARFGAEIDDVVAEFLDLALAHEQSGQPSLLGFLAELRSREVIIKRELGESGGVRVMTVHGAKGLEAPIVILADAASTEEGRDRRTIYMSENPPLFFHASSKASHAPRTMEHKENADAAQLAEYWRKLYVAMTRAEDELYVTGYLTKARDGKGSWYEAIAEALTPESEIVTDADGAVKAMIYPSGAARTQATGAAVAPSQAIERAPIEPLPPYRLRRIVRPSSAADEADANRVLASEAERLVGRDPAIARREGTALHALLHHLLKLPPEQREAVAAKAVAALLPDLPESHEGLARKARSILGRPELARLFGPGSRGEIPVLARGLRGGAPITIAGRIDRLVVEPQTVWVIDYKSDATLPANPASVPKPYLTQLGLYARIAGQLFPGLGVEAKILWTGPESLMKLPPELLRDAVSGFTIG